MGQTTDEIENQIETTRESLRSNFEELETRVKSATDWRHYYKEHTGMMMAVAFGGGLLLSTLTRADTEATAADAADASNRNASSGTKHEVHRTFDTIASALVGTAATKLKGVLGEVIPGFSDHLAQTEGRRTGDFTQE
jgi:hypothetical protein